MIIAHNIAAINTNRQLGVSTRGTSTAMEKLSSGYKINTGKDDPSGLVISEKLRAQESGLKRAVQNTEEAMNVLGIAEGALNEINSILKKAKQLAIHSASDGVTSPEQIAADQAELDSAVQTIDRIARTTKFSDQSLLAGGKQLSFDTTTLTQGTQNNKLLDANGSQFDQIFRRGNYAVTLGFTGTQNADSLTAIGDVDFAKQAMKAYLEVDTAKGTLSQVDENGKFTQAQSFILTGSKGSRAFNFDKGASVTEMVSMIHSSADTTGVDASLVFNSSQAVNKLEIATYQGRSVTGVTLPLRAPGGGNLGDAQFVDQNGIPISFNFYGELVNGTEPDGEFSIVISGVSEEDPMLFDIMYNGVPVLSGWNGKSGRFSLEGPLLGVDIETTSDVNILNSFPTGITGIFDTLSIENTFLNATGGTVTMNFSQRSAILGIGGRFEIEITDYQPAPSTNAGRFVLSIRAYDSNDVLVASANSATTLGYGSFTGSSSSPTMILTPHETDLNPEYVTGVTLTRSGASLNLGESTAKGNIGATATFTMVDYTINAPRYSQCSTGLDLTSLNPPASKEADKSKYYAARDVETVVDAGLKNDKNEPVGVALAGKLANPVAYAEQFENNPPRLTISTNNTAGSGMPTTYTVRYGSIELANNWNGDASTFNFAGTGALEGLHFSIENKTANNLNLAFSFADQLSITTPGDTASQTAASAACLSGVSGGSALRLDYSGASAELKAYLIAGYQLRASVVDLTGGTLTPPGFAFASNTLVNASAANGLTLRLELVHANGDVIAGTGSLALSNGAAAITSNINATGLFSGLKAGFVAPTYTGANKTFTAADLSASSTRSTAPTAWEITAGASARSDPLVKNFFYDTLLHSTVAFGASIVGGATHTDDASRTSGTVAVFGNTIASDGSGMVERGVTDVAYQLTTENGVATSAADNIHFGMNTDGQGRVYVQFNRDNNSYSLYKDASMSEESKVAVGIAGQACTEFNNSGLNGLIIDLAAGPNNDLFDEKGVYISFAGIEGRARDTDDDNGLTFNGDVIADGGREKAGSFDAERTLVTGVELGKNTSPEGQVYLKSVYDHENGTVQVFAYKDANRSDASMVAKSAVYNVRDLDNVDYKSMTVILSEIRNDDDTLGTGLGMVLSYEDFAFDHMTASTEIFGDITFTNLAARIYSQDYGSDAIVKVNQSQGGIFTYYDTAGNNNSQKLLDAGSSGITKEFKGQDATLSINGQKVTTNGLDLNVATQDLQARLKFNAGKAGTTTIAQVGYGEGSIFTGIGALNYGGVEADARGLSGLICNAGHVTTERIENFQNGMQLQLGESSGDQDRSVVSIQSMTMDALGRVVKSGAWESGSSVISDRVFTLQDIMGGGQAALQSDPLLTMEILEKAIDDVTGARARIGAMQSNLLQTNSNNLAVSIENIQKTESGIRDTDMAVSMSEMTKQQVLQSAGMTMLSQANQMTQNILQLLR